MKHVLLKALLLTGFLLALSGGARAAEQTVVLKVDMWCPSCPYIIKRSLMDVDGVEEVAAVLGEFALADAGYQPHGRGIGREVPGHLVQRSVRKHNKRRNSPTTGEAGSDVPQLFEQIEIVIGDNFPPAGAGLFGRWARLGAFLLEHLELRPSEQHVSAFRGDPQRRIFPPVQKQAALSDEIVHNPPPPPLVLAPFLPDPVSLDAVVAELSDLLGIRADDNIHDMPGPEPLGGPHDCGHDHLGLDGRVNSLDIPC
ncbi:hypothetical protein LCGC14_3088660, partial [marine sediment metagenome]